MKMIYILKVFLDSSLSQALQQNAELRGRLARIHADSDLSEISVPPSMSELVRSI